MMKGSTLQDAKQPGFDLRMNLNLCNLKHLNIPTEVTGLSQKHLSWQS